MAVVLPLTAAGVAQPGAAGVESKIALTVTVAESEITGVTGSALVETVVEADERAEFP